MKKLIPLLLISLLFLSCSSQLKGVLREGGSADLTIRASIEPKMSSLIRSLKAVMGNPGSDLILDGSSISRSMGSSPGVKTAKFVNINPSELEGTIEISRIEDFLSPGKETRFITYSESRLNGKSTGSIMINLNRKTIPGLLVYLSAEATDYLSALMAPAVLDEEISKKEYLSLIGSLYGSAVAEEIRNANIWVVIDLPEPVKSIKGGTAEGSRTVFHIPVLDLLVLETPLSWEIVW